MATEQAAIKGFTDHALEKMMDLFHHHDHEVGSELKKIDPDQYADCQATDCITYALNVLTYAFSQLGEDKAAARAWQLGQHGTELAKYLVESHGWKGIYINPDSKHPVDGDDEHTYTSILAARDAEYYKIPLEYIVQDYTVTPEWHENFQTLNPTAPVTKRNTEDIASLEEVAFGFGVSRGGRHTWLFSKGEVYEVHWNGIGDDLYEATRLRIFGWLSSVIVIPPEQACHLAASARIKP